MFSLVSQVGPPGRHSGMLCSVFYTVIMTCAANGWRRGGGLCAFLSRTRCSWSVSVWETTHSSFCAALRRGAVRRSVTSARYWQRDGFKWWGRVWQILGPDAREIKVEPVRMVQKKSSEKKLCAGKKKVWEELQNEMLNCSNVMLRWRLLWNNCRILVPCGFIVFSWASVKSSGFCILWLLPRSCVIVTALYLSIRRGPCLGGAF